MGHGIDVRRFRNTEGRFLRGTQRSFCQAENHVQSADS
jgi:hypothetical protein